ncbi:YggS family pyridoxal phosphate-dependent enzyme [Pseudohongiella sp.]|uniref:Alanine racemase N-terminal domain-containing protein n=1 Tax=marine sediment metagenome TaxID=412755 RepID=A0A0F9W6V8_9ZZZZ|nr:YggS family pyridoxal phosphate-dependent enzyme [Pseudohongiella sp.]HDZ07808.1 YggS family pyridoxal phosphate-dependent enzyme [Pseudohongiella sp.]HEA62875.1 YggS family pyridoxal phosphate-dependent enzyme [Pseudohongiella sp.]
MTQTPDVRSSATSSTASNYRDIVSRIKAQEQRFGRDAGSVLLLAVSKTHGADKVREAYAAGARQFGENYVQEALDKIALLAQPPDALTDISWHFIGPIQSNKTRDIAGAFDWVHSVDRLKIAQRLNDQRPADLPALNICVQVNLSNEDSKSGVALSEAAALCASIATLPRLQLRGLMAIPAPCRDHDQQRAAFQPLAALFAQLQQQYPTMDTLSIGMSDDFDAAIAEGSTMIRIGTAIFGARG